MSDERLTSEESGPAVPDHSPEPWAVQQERFEYVVRDANRRRLFAGSWHASNDVSFPLQPESERNLRLAASAPALLALAKQYAGECSGCDGKGTWMGPDLHTESCEDCADIRAIINKAEGRV